MPCTPFLGGMICTRGRKKKTEPCFVRDCRRPSQVLCDWIISRPKGGPNADGKIEPIRCSRPCCRHHAKHVDVDKDLCLEHALELSKKNR